ncbi:hypothetical protein POTOM_044491 [Populus tomentosa]|uniref:Uncharacterized protein n=1 Tax=Populus tomentosa TaxID=118781 RepID=A0A8X8CEL5_POPTO|nr:hypothetical protein POTOM_044491 [Populus tomentosa]
MCPPKPLRYKGCRIQTAHSNVPFRLWLFMCKGHRQERMYAIEHAELVARNAGVFHQEEGKDSALPIVSKSQSQVNVEIAEESICYVICYLISKIKIQPSIEYGLDWRDWKQKMTETKFKEQHGIFVQDLSLLGKLNICINKELN